MAEAGLPATQELHAHGCRGDPRLLPMWLPVLKKAEQGAAATLGYCGRGGQ